MKSYLVFIKESCLVNCLTSFLIKFIVTLVLVIYMTLEISVFSAFKDVGWSARPVGMGGAFSAISDDASSIYYNPAGLVQISKYEANFTYSKLYYGLEGVDIGLNCFSAVIPKVKFLNQVGMQWSSIRSESYEENSVSISFAKKLENKLTSNLFIGLNIKYFWHTYLLDENSKLDPLFMSSNMKGNFSFDLGVLFGINDLTFKNFLFAAAVKNINQPNLGIEEDDIVPAEARIGLSYSIEKILIFKKIIAAFDFNYRNQNWSDEISKRDYYVGSEFSTIYGIILRAGLNSYELSCGIGIDFITLSNIKMKFDYGFMAPYKIRNSLGTHRVTISIQF